MKTVLLILVLFGDGGEPLAKALQEDLARRGGERVQVVIGADAAKRLEAKGLHAGDLLVAPNTGAALTGADKDLVVVYLDRRTSAGDTVVDSRVWLDGREDRHSAIAGQGGDATQAALQGVAQILGHRIGGPAPLQVQAAADEGALAQFAARGQWTELLGILAGVKDRSPRQSYYEVLAYSRLRQRDAAVEAFNRMRLAHPKHFLLGAAEEIIPPAAVGGAATDDGGNTLRDAPPADDGGNTLRDVPRGDPAQPPRHDPAPAPAGALPSRP